MQGRNPRAKLHLCELIIITTTTTIIYSNNNNNNNNNLNFNTVTKSLEN